MNTTIKFCIRNFLAPNFSKKWQFWFFVRNFPENAIKNRKIEHGHGVLHIRMSVGTKFHWQQTVLKYSFCPKTLYLFLVKNRKTEQLHLILHKGICLSTKLSYLPKVDIFDEWASLLNSAYSNKSTSTDIICLQFNVFQ